MHLASSSKQEEKVWSHRSVRARRYRDCRLDVVGGVWNCCTEASGGHQLTQTLVQVQLEEQLKEEVQRDEWERRALVVGSGG